MGKEDIQIEFIKDTWTNTLMRIGLVFEQQRKKGIRLLVKKPFR